MGEGSSSWSRRPGARRGLGARRGAAGAMVLLAATTAAAPGSARPIR